MEAPVSDLEQRIGVLEQIIVAMCSSQQFAITLDANGRPQMWTELPAARIPGAIAVNPKWRLST
jgi:hypothetical protein